MASGATFSSNKAYTEVFPPELYDGCRSFSDNLSSFLHSSNEKSAEQPFPSTSAVQLESSCLGSSSHMVNGVSVPHFHPIQQNVGVANDNQETASVSTAQCLHGPDGISRMSVQPMASGATFSSNKACTEVFAPELYDGCRSFSNNLSSFSHSFKGNSMEQLLISMATMGATNMESSYSVLDSTVMGNPVTWNLYPTQKNVRSEDLPDWKTL